MNEDIKRIMADAGVKQWQVADELHKHEQTFYRQLRYELSEQERNEILRAIEIASARAALHHSGYKKVIALKQSDPELYAKLMSRDGNDD